VFFWSFFSVGSCWAFAAAGSLEASAARREAYIAYTGSLGTKKLKHVNETVRQEAVVNAQNVEQEAFHMLNLSVQELLDCDTAADQGCTGGNPLLAFYYIHRYGLTSWENYPYVGYEDKCHTKRVRDPLATVTSWGVISPNHETHMALVIRHIGPVAVGVNGADHSFLSYRGGIFYKESCKQGSNHALLIVGYGEENGERYWIARNSWGTGWGENGFVRVRRGDGHKGTPGVCGIARSPSVALGGILLKPGSWKGTDSSGGLRGFGDYLVDEESSVIRNVCVHLGHRLQGPCVRADEWLANTYHMALFLGCLGILIALVALWPLTRDCRNRRRRRLLREQRRHEKEEQERLEKDGHTSEEESLLADKNGRDASYGGTDGS
jgi:hypothetical protein